MPYRSGRSKKRAQAPKVAAVSEMVRQFSDAYAFLRELVQNGVDAGAKALRVHVQRGPDGVTTTSVTDDGAGMTREIIEGPLLTLFSSSKEGDGSKIGKYGVGFMSVFAVEPTLVTVSTWRPEGAWLVKLSADHDYELEQADPRPASGTTVTLFQELDGDSFHEHVKRVRAALKQWCRHVAVPTSLFVAGASIDGTDAAEERIDVPIDVRSLAHVEIQRDRERFVVGVGATPARLGAGAVEDAEQYAGFFNRGLLLYETTQPLLDEAALGGLSGIRYKIDSPSLAHTLSRDNVRRDESFHRLVGEVKRIVRRELRQQAARRIAELAAAPEAALDHLALVVRARAEPLSLRDKDIVVPLASPVAGARVASIAEVRSDTPLLQKPLCAAAEDDLTAALAGRGRPVVRMSVDMLAACSVAAVPAHGAFSYLVPAEGDRELWDAVAAALDTAGAPAASIGGARVIGSFPKAIALRAGRDGRLIRAGDGSPKWGASHELFVLVDAPIVGAALARARSGAVASAASLLARALLVAARGPIGETAADCLLDAGLEAASR